MKKHSFFFLVMSIALSTHISASDASVSLCEYGELDGRPVTLYTLTNTHGMVARITNYGGIVVSLHVPDRAGKFEDVVLGFDNFEGYKDDQGYYGAIIGRNANRIANGKFMLGGETYELAQNNGLNNFHGGVNGFNKKLWEGHASIVNGEPTLRLTYVSPDGEEGFPGMLEVSTTYTLTVENGLKIHYEARSDKPTICNLTHHSYWNIGGPSSDSILEHELQLFCNAFNPTDTTAIPTGEIRLVAGTPFDFRQSQPIGSRIDVDDAQLGIGKGYDHNYVINGNPGELRPVARVYDRKSGRVMEMLSTDRGVQFYSGNWFDGTIVGRNGTTYTHRIALCLECQHFPDSPNQPNFVSATLLPGELYEKTTVYRFSTQSAGQK